MKDGGEWTQLPLPIPGKRRRRAVFDAPRVRVELVCDGGSGERVVIKNSSDLYELFRAEVATWERERFVTVLLDNKHAIIGVEEVSVGSLTSSVVHPREVFKALILANAAGFICLHNHPSGDPTPSAEDIAITRRLRECAEVFGIRFLDHLVFGRGSFVSLVESGYW